MRRRRRWVGRRLISGGGGRLGGDSSANIESGQLTTQLNETQHSALRYCCPPTQTRPHNPKLVIIDTSSCFCSHLRFSSWFGSGRRWFFGKHRIGATHCYYYSCFTQYLKHKTRHDNPKLVIIRVSWCFVLIWVFQLVLGAVICPLGKKWETFVENLVQHCFPNSWLLKFVSVWFSKIFPTEERSVCAK